MKGLRGLARWTTRYSERMEWWEAALAGALGGAGTYLLIDGLKRLARYAVRPHFTLRRGVGDQWVLTTRINPKHMEGATAQVGQEQQSFYAGRPNHYTLPAESELSITWNDRGRHTANTIVREGDNLITFRKNK